MDGDLEIYHGSTNHSNDECFNTNCVYSLDVTAVGFPPLSSYGITYRLNTCQTISIKSPVVLIFSAFSSAFCLHLILGATACTVHMVETARGERVVQSHAHLSGAVAVFGAACVERRTGRRCSVVTANLMTVLKTWTQIWLAVSSSSHRPQKLFKCQESTKLYLVSGCDLNGLYSAVWKCSERTD